MNQYFSRFSLYDILGYLLPGAVLVFTVAIVLAVCNTNWAVPALSGAGQWVAAIMIAYFSGHIVQAIADRVVREEPQIRRVEKHWQTPLDLDKALEHFGVHARDTFEQLRALRALKIEFPNRDGFIALRGFFRGSCLVFGLLAFALALPCLTGRSIVVFETILDPSMCTLAGVGAAGASVIYYFRYGDFTRHIIGHSVAAAVKAMAGSKKGES